MIDYVKSDYLRLFENADPETQRQHVAFVAATLLRILCEKYGGANYAVPQRTQLPDGGAA